MDSVISRSRWILVILIGAMCLCGVRLVQLQIIEGPVLAAQGQRVRTSSTAVAAARGSITDATGVVLANSIQTYDIAVNQVNIRSYVHYDDDGNEVGRGPAEAAHQLAPLLGVDEAELGGMMLGESTYEYIKRNVDAVTYREIRKLDIYGIEWESVFEREYPNGNVAAPVIGTVNAEGQGSSGMEAQFDQLLTGTPGAQAFEIAPNGAVMPGGKRTTVEPKNGGSVELTIHADLQHQVQDLLDARVAKHQADWGTVVIEDVATGHILVIADSNSKEPDNAHPQKVHAVQDTFEPGSVGKLITVGAALNQGTITPTSVFQVPYSLNLPDAGGPITDFHQHGGESLTATGVLAESSNTGTVLIGQTMTDDQRYSMMRAFGFGQETGIELPGESAGLLRSSDEWQGRDRYVTMFGQAYAITAVQEASALATIANGGVRIMPHIVKSWTNADGTVEVPEGTQPVQVLEATTASQLLTMMESVVEDDLGTAAASKVPGYRVAVKTGTAETIIDGLSGLVSTTAGIVPVDAPRRAIAVVLYNPRVASVSSESSAPLFGDIAPSAVGNLGIPASSGSATLYPTTP